MNCGGLGARALNIELQKTLNPPGDIRIEQFPTVSSRSLGSRSFFTVANDLCRIKSAPV